jgi:hypothetical protein
MIALLGRLLDFGGGQLEPAIGNSLTSDSASRAVQGNPAPDQTDLVVARIGLVLRIGIRASRILSQNRKPSRPLPLAVIRGEEETKAPRKAGKAGRPAEFSLTSSDNTFIIGPARHLGERDFPHYICRLGRELS